MSNCTEVTSPFIVKREVKKVAVVVFASNTSLCGGFNANVIRHLVDLLAEYKPLGLENILVFPVGKKVADAVRKLGFRIEGDFQHMADKPSYQEAADLAADLMKRFLHGDVDKVELLYNHFKSTASQILTRETYLPIDLNNEKIMHKVKHTYQVVNNAKYICEDMQLSDADKDLSLIHISEPTRPY